MRAFLDTSSLFKKYVEEHGSNTLDRLLQEISEIAVSPVTWIEINAVVARRLRDKSLTAQQAAWLRASGSSSSGRSPAAEASRWPALSAPLI